MKRFGFALGTLGQEVHPWHAEHFPCANGFSCRLPRTFTSAKLNAIMVYVVSRWQGSSRCSDLRVRET
jgi:hypothetical protein